MPCAMRNRMMECSRRALVPVALGLLAGACSQDQPDQLAPDLSAPIASADAGAAARNPGDTWIPKASMLTARRNLAAAVLRGELYTLGGEDGSGSTLAAVEAYSPRTDRWTAKAPLPDGRSYGNGAGVIDGLLYLAGGYSLSLSAFTSTLYVYDASTNSWSLKANLPLNSGCGATGVINSKLYVLTGCVSTSGLAANLFHRYDPATDSWTSLPTPASSHMYPASGVINGKFYVAGGFDGTGNITGSLEVYDPASNSWSTRQSIPTARVQAAGSVIKGKLYVAGGMGQSFAALGDTEEYDPRTDTWTTKAATTPRYWLAAGVVKDVLYAVGGITVQGALSTTEAYKPGSR
jgi:N-acetylneuraminic acid mutarotase